ncbi:hypothetical protein QOZ80_1BG0059440 [Eleusine coracana subsp. coracana]|nr:hypothetical protein QOZ80_1BG0059440 [Eleusine coracana subsp. coracana]
MGSNSKLADDDLGSLAAASFPLLVYDHGEQPDNSQVVFSVADGSSHTCQVPEMKNHRCLETPRGLVLTVDTTTLHSSLWNTQTGEKIALPAMDKQLPEHCRCLISDTVSSPDCLVLVYDMTQPELLFCQVTGSVAWISQSYDIGLYELPPSHPDSHIPPSKVVIGSMAAVQGKFYFLHSNDVLGVFSYACDPEPHLELSTLDAPEPTIVRDAPQVVTMSYLLESSSRELFLVCLFYLGCSFERVEEVGAYRMDFSKQEWRKVNDIGDTAFLLGPQSFAASCSAVDHGLKRGCVYFAYDLFEESYDFQVFDLLEGTRELAAGPTQDIPPVLARHPFWMVPVLL